MSEGHRRKGNEIVNWRVHLYQIEREKKFCPNRAAFMNTLKRKLIGLFNDILHLRQDYLKRRLNWTEENEIGEMLILIFLKMADILDPREWNSIRQINCLIRLEWDKSGPREELETRNQAFHEDRARN